METKFDKCPECGEKLTGMFTSNRMLDENEIAIIKEFVAKDKTNGCITCKSEELDEGRTALAKEYETLHGEITVRLPKVPVISIHTPLNWDYNVLGMVTGQTTTGTGVISEFTSSFTDFFGAQSGAYNKKLAKGEEMVMSQMRAKAVKLGANAVIASDLDYSELGDGKGMLMVCGAGTAIKLNNVGNVFDQKLSETLKELSLAAERKIELFSYFKEELIKHGWN
jgi:uncharacterized protein YbjQ (UPF0145 family)